MKNFLKNLFEIKSEKKSYLANCGHNSLIEDNVSAFGETTKTKVPLIDGKIEYCHQCLSKMAIQCAWCGKPIFIGDPITLYTPSEEFEIPKHAVVYSEEPLQLVGCRRSDCADTGADYCGVWYPPGKVQRIASAIEIAMANPDHAVIGNIHDGFELKKIREED